MKFIQTDINHRRVYYETAAGEPCAFVYEPGFGETGGFVFCHVDDLHGMVVLDPMPRPNEPIEMPPGHNFLERALRASIEADVTRRRTAPVDNVERVVKNREELRDALSAVPPIVIGIDPGAPEGDKTVFWPHSALAALVSHEQAERAAKILFPDDVPLGHCFDEAGRPGQPCRICRYRADEWTEIVARVRNAMITGLAPGSDKPGKNPA